MRRNLKRLLSVLLTMTLCLSLLPGTAWAANFPSKFYAALMGFTGIGTVSSSLTYTQRNTEAPQVHGMEYAGGVFFTVEGKGSDDGWRELRMYNSDLTNSRTIGEVNSAYGGYWIIDTAMDLSGQEPVLYGTYNGYALVGGEPVYCSSICRISLTDGKTSNWQTVTGIPSTDIIYAMAFDKNGTLYAISADMGDYGGPASLYTIDTASGAATEVGKIKDSSGEQISTNYVQDLAFDYATGTLYWAENAENVLYTVNTATAAATRQGQVKYSNVARAVQSFCIPYTPPSSEKHMISVFCEGEGKITTAGGSDEAFYMVDNGDSITLTITPDHAGGLRYVKVDGATVTLSNPTEYTFPNVTKNHVIEVAFKVSIPATQKNMTWFHYQGYPASFYTQHHVYKFYDLPYLDTEVPREGYTQTLLDNRGYAISDDTVIIPGNYGVHVTHPGTEVYYPMDVTYQGALQLRKCPGTPGRPVVYGKVGCKQGDLTTTSALQDYYGTDGELIDAAHDEIPVTLVWQEPDTIYNQAGYFSAKADIYAAEELDQLLLDCYNLDDGTPLTGGCQISARNTQVIVLPADQASLIKLAVEGDEGSGTVSGQGVYKNGTEVTVTAAANENEGYTFGGWQENGQIVDGAGATYTFTANGDCTLTAVFVSDPYYLVKLQADPADGGTVSGSGNYKEDGHSATVTATANQGYYFMGWYAAGSDEAVNTNTEYGFVVPENGITLTARFGVDYLTKAEQAKTAFENAMGNNTLSWAALVQAVDAYEAAADFVNNPPSVIQDAETRYAALTAYYQSVTALDLSNQGIDNADLAKLYLFTGVTELNLSGNRGVTDLTGLTSLTTLTTLDISNTGVTNLGSNQSVPQNLATLTAKNLSLTSISALAELVSAEGFNTDAITKWDFTGSTLPDAGNNKADVAAIQEKLGEEKFLPPTIQAPPSGGGGGGGGVATYAVNLPAALTGGALSVSPKQASQGATVTITVTPDEGYALDKLTVTDKDGKKIDLTDKGGGKYTFTMPGSQVNVEAAFQPVESAPVNPFADVSESAWYYDAVLWAVDKGVTNGTGPTTFSPDMTVSRAQMVTFLWRAHGSPKATGSNPFADVSQGAWYYDAVLWAVESGVTKGTSATTFSPDDPVTRAQAVTFQWRAAGEPKATGGSFADVPAGTWYTDAVTWAVSNQITEGTGGDRFSPEAAVTRAQAVAFLYRALA